MSSRETILNKVKIAQPSFLPLPQPMQIERNEDMVLQFRTVLESIGGKLIILNEEQWKKEEEMEMDNEIKRETDSEIEEERVNVRGMERETKNERETDSGSESGGSREMEIVRSELREKIPHLFPEAKRIVSALPFLEEYFLTEHKNILPHSLQNVDVAILKSSLGIAENGAVWVTEEELKIRALPFICEHLVVILNAGNIVPTMHQAYDRIGLSDYGFGVFIAGPSKTADIEQSLVLGAHGPKTMTILLTNFNQNFF